MDDVTGGWRKLHNEEFRDLCSSPSIINIIIITLALVCERTIPTEQPPIVPTFCIVVSAADPLRP
jgi:hypothetical protein